MKILFVHNYYQQRGGEDAVFEEEVKLLRENGYTVETVVFSNEGFDGSLIGNVTNAVKSLYNSQSARQVEKVIDRFQPDIVHIHNLFYTASPSVIRAAKQRGIPVVMTLHNYRLVCNSGMLSRESEIPCERCLEKTIPLAGVRHGCFRNSYFQSMQLTAITSFHKIIKTWKSVDRFIVLTEFAREKILQSSLKLRSEQVVVKPNYIEDLDFVGTDEREDFFLYIGRLHYEKGIHSLMKAAYLNNFPIEVIGDGPLRPLVEKTASELKHIKYHGFLPRKEGIERMKKCRAIIVPSIWYEGLPTTILEAFSTGTPVICSNQKNLRDIVIHEQNGLNFEVGNPESISMTMNSLTKKDCVRFANEGLKDSNLKYSKTVVLNKIKGIYESCSTTA